MICIEVVITSRMDGWLLFIHQLPIHQLSVIPLTLFAYRHYNMPGNPPCYLCSLHCVGSMESQNNMRNACLAVLWAVLILGRGKCLASSLFYIDGHSWMNYCLPHECISSCISPRSPSKNLRYFDIFQVSDIWNNIKLLFVVLYDLPYLIENLQ